MNEKDKSELDIPNFGDVLISDSDIKKEPVKKTKVEQNFRETSIKANAQATTSNAHKDDKTAVWKNEAKQENKEEIKPMPNMQGARKEEPQPTKKPQEMKKPQEAKKPQASKPQQKQKPKAKAAKQPKGKRKPNYLVIASLIVLAIPCLVLLYIILSSHETKGEPVIGNRFDDALVNEISEADVTALQGALQLENTDKITVNLKSATLRITIDTKDDLAQADVEALMNQAYDIAVEKFPIDKYFTNQKDGETTVKMYDLEVTAYNFIPAKDNQEEKANQIHMSRTKNAAAESDVVDVLTTAKNPEESEGILNPDTSNPPTTQGDAEGE